MRRANNYAMFESIEEALDLQKRNFELNLFFRNNKTSLDNGTGNEKSKQRLVKEAIQVILDDSRCRLMGHSKYTGYFHT